MTQATENIVKFNRKNFIGIAIAVLLIVAAIGASKINSANKPEPEYKTPEPKVNVVSAVSIAPEAHTPILTSTATVQAWQESKLDAQVTGRLIWLCDCLETGIRVKKGEVLAKIETVDYQVAVAQAKQSMANAKQSIAEEKARSEQAQVDWQNLDLGEPTDLALRKPQLETAQANLRRRELELQQALRNLNRTQIKAPYDGIITARSANLGNFISMGSSLGTILNTERVQIRFALSPNDINKIDTESTALTIQQASNSALTWPANIVQIDSVIDSKTRLVNVITEVQDPFNIEKYTSPLRVGSFVTAEFLGKALPNSYSLPSSAVLADKSVYLVNDQNKIQITKVNILHRNPDSVIVSLPNTSTQALQFILQGQGALSEGLAVQVQNTLKGQ